MDTCPVIGVGIIPAKCPGRKMFIGAWLAVLVPYLSHAASQFDIGTVLWNSRSTGHAYDTQYQYPRVSLDLRNDFSFLSCRNPSLWFVWR